MLVQENSSIFHRHYKALFIPLLIASLSACGGSGGGDGEPTGPSSINENDPSFMQDTTTLEPILLRGEGGGRETAIRLMKLNNALMILLDVIPRGVLSLENGVFTCAGGGSIEAIITLETSDYEFNDCVFFIGNTMSLNGGWQFSRVDGSNGYTNLTFRTAGREVTASGLTDVNPTSMVNLATPRDLTITEGQSTATIRTGNVALRQTDSIAALEREYEVTFADVPNRQFDISITSEFDMPGFCPNTGVMTADVGGVEQFELRFADGENYTITTGDNSDTIACSETGFFLEAWPARNR